MSVAEDHWHSVENVNDNIILKGLTDETIDSRT